MVEAYAGPNKGVQTMKASEWVNLGLGGKYCKWSRRT